MASIRPDDRGLFVRPPSRGQFTATGAVAKLLVMFAYDVQDSQIVGGPPWFATDKWAIQAKSDKDQYSVEETHTMLQHLLVDRFSLRLHRSTQELSVYVRTVAKGGPKFKVSEGARTNVQIGPNSISLQAATIDRLTTVLATSLGRPVIDRAGLTGSTICQSSGTMPQFGMVACPELEPRPQYPEMIEARFSRHYPIRSACGWIPNAPQWRYWSWTELNGQQRID